jgi:Cd2+/Zn2+-exporting ATPase
MIPTLIPTLLDECSHSTPLSVHQLLAQKGANVLLMADDLSRLPRALALAKRARRIVRQNLIFAFTVMAALMLLAIIGNIALPLGVVGHAGSTLLCW